MNKNLSWKKYLLIALICYSIKFIGGAYMPNFVVAVLEIVGLITLILGIISGIKVIFTKK